MRSKMLAAIGAALLATTLAQPAEAAVGHWEANLLALPAGHPDATGWVRGTDSHGGYAGHLVLDGHGTVVTWSKGQPTVHPQPTGFESTAVADENSAGTVLCDSVGAASEHQLFLLGRDGGYQGLAQPTEWPLVTAVALNERGDVVGNASNWSGESVVLVWHAADRAHPVEITGLPSLSATDIDDDGTVLLNSYPHSVLWRDGEFQELTTLPGQPYTFAQAIRNGQVTGNSAEFAGGPGQAAVWRTPTEPAALPSSHAAFGINRYGLIVGYDTSATPLAAWLGTRSMGSLPPAPGFTQAWAKAVGDDGTIAGVVSNSEPTTNGGRPVVWRYSLP
ncbi:hypothetical protein M8542_37565 [Amycolatopsis sp. OK19-0408]|uniref:HAF family extracellular repeat protein n=1 Tax=Amycolatopsis iheyensis TaxID=2945988 RepID=A0A9X2NLK1_9PSEU|nr:hypothetical protein [Amycolatopsis iheyensis]MCR6488552.1 hypothetical protein [Amycolatopsis iheyensis]